MTYTVDQTLEWLERAVEERGADFNYREHFGRPAGVTASDVRDQLPVSDCRYVEFDDNDEPTVCGCIAGQVFAYAGIPLDEQREYEGSTAYRIAQDRGFNMRAALVLSQAQRTQDRNKTWGEALQAAREYAQLLAERTYRDNVDTAA